MRRKPYFQPQNSSVLWHSLAKRCRWYRPGKTDWKKNTNCFSRDAVAMKIRLQSSRVWCKIQSKYPSIYKPTRIWKILLKNLVNRPKEAKNAEHAVGLCRRFYIKKLLDKCCLKMKKVCFKKKAHHRFCKL